MRHRRAFALLIALGALFAMISFAVLFARFSFLAIRAERLADSGARAEFALQSAAAWLELHHATLTNSEPVTLELNESSEAAAAQIRIERRIVGDQAAFRVEITLPRGASQVRRIVEYSVTPRGRVLRRTSMDSKP